MDFEDGWLIKTDQEQSSTKIKKRFRSNKKTGLKLTKWFAVSSNETEAKAVNQNAAKK